MVSVPKPHFCPSKFHQKSIFGWRDCTFDLGSPPGPPHNSTFSENIPQMMILIFFNENFGRDSDIFSHSSVSDFFLCKSLCSIFSIQFDCCVFSLFFSLDSGWESFVCAYWVCLLVGAWRQPISANRPKLNRARLSRIDKKDTRPHAYRSSTNQSETHSNQSAL